MAAQQHTVTATPFQQAVWEAIRQIPTGRVTTYGDIAAYLGTKAVRAVGTAAGRNPNAPQVPCHRVVCADGKIGKYSGPGAVKRKKELLSHEGVEIAAGKIVDFETLRYRF